MPEYKDFEMFARDLFTLASEIPINVRERADLVPTALMTRAAEVVEIFADGHCSKIRRILKKSLVKEFRTDEEFMRFTIPKCLNLIDDEKYFYSMMLVAAFIEELTHNLYENQRCFRFKQTGYKCFAAVFKRRFEAGFEAHGGFKGLDKYFRSVFKGIDERKKDYCYMMLLNGCDRDATLKVADLIRNCDDERDKYLLLNDYELSMAEDAEETKKEWFDDTIVNKNDTLLEMEWNMETPRANVKVKSVYDKQTEVVQSTCIEGTDSNGNDATGVLEGRHFPIPGEEEEHIESDVETSGSEANLDNIFDQFAFSCFSFMKPDEFDQMMSSRQCDWCGTQCYQYAKYVTKKHVRLALRDERSKFVKTLSNVVGKVKSFVGKVVWWFD